MNEDTAAKADPAKSGDTDDAAAEAAKAKPITIPKARLDEEIAKRRAVESQLSEVAEAFVAEVPEEYRALVPDLGSATKIKWIRDAKAAGIFGAKAQVAATDTRRPQTTPKSEDVSMLPPEAKLARLYAAKK